MSGLFCCPICGGALCPDGNSMRCPKGHCFDRAAEGYLHLLPSNRMNSRLPGDNKEMVASRRTFLETGYYDIFSDGINRLACALLSARTAPKVLDAGCGEGYYTARLEAALRERGISAEVSGFDISKFAVKAAAKRYKQSAFAVASIFDIPVAANCCELLLNIFAPIVPEEFCRVLKTGGYLLIAVPSERHLLGLKEILYDRPYRNERVDTVYEGFVFLERLPLRGVLTLTDRQQIWNLFSMTPYYWKTPAQGAERLKALDTLSTEIGFDLLLYQKK